MKQYPPYSEGTAETMSKIEWDSDRLQLQINKLDLIDSDVKSGTLEVNLAEAYEHLKTLEGLIKELVDDNALWLQKHESDLDERFIYCSPRFRAIIVELCPSLPARKRAVLMHQAIRDQIHRGSRPGLGSVNIMDLPNEVLSRISSFVLDDLVSDDFQTRDKYVRYIKSLRLTCWRFHNASSCFLVKTLTVDMTPKSLSRLDLFSQHPTISKGILIVRVFLDYYDSVLAKDMQAFARYHATHFHNLTQRVDNLAYENNILDLPVETLVEAVKKGPEYVNYWIDFSSGIIRSDSQYLKILHEAHRLYQSNFDTQEKLRNGEFITAIAAAFERMQMVETLEIRDYRSKYADDSDQMYERKGRPSYCEVVHDHEAMVESMVFPIKWEHTRKHELGHPCIDQLVRLPATIYLAGCNLTAFHIDVSGPRDLALFATEKDQLAELTNSMQNLKTFSFFIRDERDGMSVDEWPPRRADEILYMGNYLTHLLDTSSLQSLTMDLFFLWDNQDLRQTPNLLSILDARVLRKWKNLSYLNLTFLPIRLQDIEALTKYVIKPRVKIDFSAILLLDGDWDVVLDMMRGHTGPHTKFHDLRFTDSASLWVEMYHAPREDSASEDEGNAALPPGSTYCTKAEAYLRGLIDYNPLKEMDPKGDSTDDGAESDSLWE